MGKQHPDQPAWQWRSSPLNAQSAALQALDLIAIPIMVVAFLLMASGVFSNNATSAVIGPVALIAGMVIQHQGRQLEGQAKDRQRSKTF